MLAGGAEAAALDLLAELPPRARRSISWAPAGSPTGRGGGAARRRDYFALPEDFDVLRRSLEREAREASGRAEAGRFAEAERSALGFEAILGRSAALRQTLDQAARVASHRDVTVLIGGETGTGKELLARAIHYGGAARAHSRSSRSTARPSRPTCSRASCSATSAARSPAPSPPSPASSSWRTAARCSSTRSARCRSSSSRSCSARCESRTIRRVGGQQGRQVDVRVIGATHLDLAAAAARGEFREDLYYRLNVVALTLPPLRERDGDIELLAETFLARIATGYGLPVPALTPELRLRCARTRGRETCAS